MNKAYKHLQIHRGKYRVEIRVPLQLRSIYNCKVIKRGLGTDSPSIATRLAAPVVAAIKSDFERHLARMRGDAKALIADAPALRRAVDNTDDESLRRHLDDVIAEQREQIAPIRFRGGVEYRDPQAAAALAVYDAVLAGAGTPLDLHIDAHVKSLEEDGLKARTVLDASRAIAMLSNFLTSKNIQPFLESVDVNLAEDFLRSMTASDGAPLSFASRKKYHGRLQIYWRWLRRRKVVNDNPWIDARAPADKKSGSDKERPFRNSEVAKLLAGTDDDSMRDPMLIAAHTGARLDVIISLKAGDIYKDVNCIHFEARKREDSGRFIAIHPQLADVIKRRMKGKQVGDDLFPEWPGPRNADSKRERSFKYSNAFTEYRRSVGVDEQRAGNRRSRVNFHSFRRWFSTRLENAGISGDMISAILGHRRTSIALGVYSAGPNADAMRKAIETIRLPGVDGEPVTDDFLIAPARS